jgi:starch synthase
MYSLRYGTVPVVRAVGGLADTVVTTGRAALSDGLRVPRLHAAALLDALARALGLFAQPVKWRALQRAGMRLDYSWDRSAAEYVKIYRRLAKNRT